MPETSARNAGRKRTDKWRSGKHGYGPEYRQYGAFCRRENVNLETSPERAEGDNMLYGVNIQGPDDLIAASDYETAVKIANAFNDWWARHIHVKRFSELDPMMWAVPVEWPYDEASHASGLTNRSHEYIGFVDFVTTQAVG